MRDRDGHRRPGRRASSARRTSSSSRRTRTPTATRSARCWRCTRSSQSLGKDSVMFMAADEFPLPHEYRHMPFDDVVHDPPADVSERVVVFLDCGNIDRMPVDFLQQRRACTSSTSTTTTTTRASATVNLVVPDASCTAEIVWRLAKELGVEITRADRRRALRRARHRHRPLHVREHHAGGPPDGGGADRGRGASRTRSTAGSTRACRSAGSSCSRARSRRVERYDDGAITLTHLTARTSQQTGAVETDSEGIVDHLRAVEGTAVAALVRELLDEDRRAAARCACARRTGAWTCRDRARVGRRRPPPGGRLHHRRALPASSWSSFASEVGRAAPAVGSAWSSPA